MQTYLLLLLSLHASLVSATSLDHLFPSSLSTSAVTPTDGVADEYVILSCRRRFRLKMRMNLWKN